MRPAKWAAAIGMVAATACTTMVPPAPPPAPVERFIRAPFDTVWQRTVGFFADSRIPIRTIDKASGLIASTDFELSFDDAEAWADCGSTSSGEPTLSRLKAINNIPRIRADFNVVVQSWADSTGVRVNLGFTGTANSPAGVVPLTCVTNGRFEEALVKSISTGGAR